MRDVMQMNYDELRRIHRLEKNTSQLSHVEEDFYFALNSFVEGERQKYLDSLKKEFSEEHARSFSNLKRIVVELCSLREKKILNKALVAAHTKEISMENLASQEKELLEGILKMLKKYNALVDKVFSANGEVESGKPQDLTMLGITLQVDVPVFIGADMKEYGPFKKGDKVSLPYKVGKLFVERKLGEMEEE